MIDSPKPTAEEQSRFSLRSFKGIEAGLGQADPVATIAQKLEEHHPGHLILVQAGKFLHGYDRNLTAAYFRSYSSRQVLQNTSNSGMSPRKSVAFFTSIGSTSMGGMWQGYNTRKGKTASLLFEVLNILPARVKTGQTSNRSITMSKQTKGVPALVFQSTQFDIIDHSGQQWLRVSQIGIALGYSSPEVHANRIYLKHAAEFTGSMTALVKRRTKGGMQEVRIFSLRGAHLLGMFARTEKAAEFRRWVLDILEMQQAAPVPALPDARYHYPRKMLDQPYFVSPKTGQATLRLSMLADTTHYVSPLLSLLNQMRSEGHDITAPFDEAVAMRTALIQADRNIEALGELAIKARFGRCAE